MFTFLASKDEEEMGTLDLSGYRRHVDIYVIEDYSFSSSRWGVVFLSGIRNDAEKIWRNLVSGGSNGRWRLVRAMKNEKAVPDGCQYHRLEILEYQERGEPW